MTSTSRSFICAHPEVMDSQTALTVIGIMGAAICAMAGYIFAALVRRQDKSDARTTHHNEVLNAIAALANERAPRANKVEDRQVEVLIDHAEISANVRLLMSERGKCEELAADIAVLKDHKSRDEHRHANLDQALQDIAGMKRDIKTLFEQSKSIPAETFDLLRPYIRTRAANG